MHETPADLARLQAILEESARTAGPAMRQNFSDPAWWMSAQEFVDFWGQGRMTSIATVSGAGFVHAAPLEISLVRGKLIVPTFGNSVRLADHRQTPRCAVTPGKERTALSSHMATPKSSKAFRPA